MKSNRIKFVVISVAFTCLMAGGIFFGRRIANKNKIFAETRHTLIGLLNVHEDGHYVNLVVHGKTFGKVQGCPPYYLDIPQINSILFVTQKEPYLSQINIHIFNLQRNSDVEIPAEIIFGRYIGCHDSGRNERIEEVQMNKILVSTELRLDPDWVKDTYSLNIEKAKLESCLQLTYNRSGQVIKSNIIGFP